MLRVQVSEVERMTPSITKYQLRALDGAPLPEWRAGAHINIVVAPEYLRQFSLSGDPADRSLYEIAVLREDSGRGGSALLHRIFSEGRKIFISKPINHFELDESASKSFLMAGGIGVTPMIAFAHRLHALGKDFELHYSARSESNAGYLQPLRQAPWVDQVIYHFSDQGTRADLNQLLKGYQPGWHLYTCGPETYITAVTDAATHQGFPEEACHLEYFAVPEQPDFESHPFKLKLARSGQILEIPADKTAT